MPVEDLGGEGEGKFYLLFLPLFSLGLFFVGPVVENALLFA